jgi:hypothetical protein
MTSWYSERGLQRGLILAAMSAALIAAWAIGYHQGANRRPGVAPARAFPVEAPTPPANVTTDSGAAAGIRASIRFDAPDDAILFEQRQHRVVIHLVHHVEHQIVSLLG